METGPLLATTHDAGRLRVTLRLTRPSDALRVRAFLEEQRPALAGHARRYTFFDPRERLVVAATAPIGGIERIVGLADVSAAEHSPHVVAAGGEVGELLREAGTALRARVRRAA